MSNKAPEKDSSRSNPLVARLTPDGAGALGVIGLTGDDSQRVLGQQFRGGGRKGLETLGVGDLMAGVWQHQFAEDGDAAAFDTARRAASEPVVLVRAAHSGWEIHTHGGWAVMRSVLDGLVAAGATEVPWNEWPLVLSGEVGDSAAAARLARAGGWRAAQILARQLAGAFEQDVAAVARLLESRQPVAITEATATITRLERAARVGLRLPTPWRVVLTGAVNAGKSSLVNALAGSSRSLVSSLAGTTRDLLETRLLLDGWEVDLVDTAGLHPEPAGGGGDRVEQAGIGKAAAALESADLVLQVEPASALLASGAAPPASRPNQLVVGTKADLLVDDAASAAADGWLLTSAVTGAGIDLLTHRIVEALVPEAQAGEDCVTDNCLTRGVPLTPAQVKQVAALRQRLECLPR